MFILPVELGFGMFGFLFLVLKDKVVTKGLSFY